MEQIVSPLLQWYRENARKLPWREHPTAYTTWVSEIMLQQTRIETVIPYYLHFIRELPDVPALASCPEEKLMKLWQGLGYYSRVRNMQKAALEVMELYDGRLPERYALLKKLKGIGEYTAGAIASIAFQEAVPAVDGNVLRIMARLTEDPTDILSPTVRKACREQLQVIIPAHAPGDFNQAVMELGEVVCLPAKPLCEKCPLSGCCLSCLHGTQGSYPVRQAARNRRVEERTILILETAHRIALKKRPDKGLLAGMYEPVNLMGALSADEAEDYVRRLGMEIREVMSLPLARHIFSHIEWQMKGYWFLVDMEENKAAEGYIFANREELRDRYAVPIAFQAYLPNKTGQYPWR